MLETYTIEGPQTALALQPELHTFSFGTDVRGLPTTLEEFETEILNWQRMSNKAFDDGHMLIQLRSAIPRGWKQEIASGSVVIKTYVQLKRWACARLTVIRDEDLSKPKRGLNLVAGGVEGSGEEEEEYQQYPYE